MSLFGWIHLSDIHLGHREATQGGDQQATLSALRTEIVRLYSEGHCPDAIFVTGDIAFSGACLSSDEYDRAAQWLRAISAEVCLEADKIFVVPGNHDVQRTADTDFEQRATLHTLRAGLEPLDAALRDKSACTSLAVRKENFYKFASNFAHVCANRFLWRYALEARNGLSLQVVGVDTALLAADESVFGRDKGRLRLSVADLTSVLTIPEVQNGEVVIVLSHHPLQDGWLANEEVAARLLRAKPHLHLTSHADLAPANEFHVNAGISERNPSPPQTFPTFRFNYGELVVNEGRLEARIWPRVLSPINHHFIPDQVIGMERNKQYLSRVLLKNFSPPSSTRGVSHGAPAVAPRQPAVEHTPSPTRSFHEKPRSFLQMLGTLYSTRRDLTRIANQIGLSATVGASTQRVDEQSLAKFLELATLENRAVQLAIATLHEHPYNLELWEAIDAVGLHVAFKQAPVTRHFRLFVCSHGKEDATFADELILQLEGLPCSQNLLISVARADFHGGVDFLRQDIRTDERVAMHAQAGVVFLSTLMLKAFVGNPQVKSLLTTFLNRDGMENARAILPLIDPCVWNAHAEFARLKHRVRPNHNRCLQSLKRLDQQAELTEIAREIMGIVERGARPNLGTNLAAEYGYRPIHTVVNAFRRSVLLLRTRKIPAIVGAACLFTAGGIWRHQTQQHPSALPPTPVSGRVIRPAEPLPTVPSQRVVLAPLDESTFDRLGTIRFDRRDHSIRAAEQDAIGRISELLNNDMRIRTVCVVGYADERGFPRYDNLTLSRERAATVRDALRERLSRTDVVLESVGAGVDASPCSDGLSESDCQELHRRIRFIPTQCPASLQTTQR